MARPNKIGLSYYSTDTDRYQDIKLKKLKHNFGTNGVAVYDYILCEIYRVKGCFIEWDESTAFNVTEYFGLKESTVTEIVNYCGVVGLFNKELLTSGRVLTSRAIQERYIRICVDAKRKDWLIPEEINLTKEETKLIHEEILVNTGESTHSKEENTKVKKRIEKQIPPENDFLNYCKEKIPEMYQGLEFSLKAKYQSWVENGWRDGYNNEITNWKTKILNTIPHLKEKSSAKKENNGKQGFTDAASQFAGSGNSQ